MSEASVVALVAVVVGALVSLGSTVANLLFTYFSRRQENEEWYHRMLFDKRLQAVQDAYAWLMKFNRALNLAKPDDPQYGWTKAMVQYCFDAREWYDQTVIYLYDDLPEASKFVALLNAASEHVEGRIEVNARQHYNAADVEVRQRVRVLLDEMKGKKGK